MTSVPVTRKRTRAFFLLTLFLVLAGCAAPKPIAIASHVWPGYEPMFLARTLGWIDPRQVELIETGSATASIEALSAGRADGAAITLDEVLRARAKGIPLTVVMVFDVSAGADVVLGRPPLNGLANLKHQRVGYEQGAVGELMITAALREGQLKLADIQPVILAPDDHLSAWQDQRVDALVTYEPIASQLRGQGAATLFDSRAIPNTIIDVLAVRSDKLDSAHEAALRHLIAAHLQALNHFRRNPQDAAYRMATRLGLAAKEVGAAYKGLVLPDIENNHRLLHGNPSIAQQAAASLATLLAYKDDLHHLISTDYLPRLPVQ